MAQLSREIARELVREGGLDIIIPDIYTSIEDSAFKNDQLTRITIPDSVTAIGDYAFGYNDLTAITIPDSVTSIGNNAFKYNKLTEVIIPDSVTSIGDYAFGYNDLTAITILDSATSIADNTFKYNKLTEITLPNSVTSIGDYAFGYNDLTAITIPDSVASIADNAFKHNKLTEVIIPDSVTSIGEDAFDYNPLESINISKDASFDPSAFPEDILVDHRDTNDIPVNIAISGSSFDENIVSGSTVVNLKSIDPDKDDTFTYAFASGGGDNDNSALTIDGDQLKIIDVPDFESKDSYLIRIQAKDSGGLTFEKSITLTVNDINEAPSNLTVSASIFEENIADGSTVAILTSTDEDVNDPHTYALISGDGDTNNDAFTIDGDQLKIIDSPDFETKTSYSIRVQTTDSGGLTFDQAFTLNVNDLVDILTPSLATQLIEDQGLNVVIPNTYTKIDAEAFKDKGITGVEIPDSIITIENNAFAGNQLQNVDIPDSVKTIEWYAFIDNQLESINLPNELKLIRFGTFNSNLLAHVTIPNSVESIQTFAFHENPSLEKISISKDANFDLSDPAIIPANVLVDRREVNDQPAGLIPSQQSFNENIAADSAVTTLSTSDPDSEDTHTYLLVNGDGDLDNDAFAIDGDQLKIVHSPDFETKDSYLVRIQAKDSGGLSFERSFTFSVNDLQEINYDLNGDQSLSIEHDAVIGLRSMFGTFPDDALIKKAWNEGSSKSLTQIQQELTGYFQDSTLDRDADGMISPLTDGIQMIEEMQALILDDSSPIVHH